MRAARWTTTAALLVLGLLVVAATTWALLLVRSDRQLSDRGSVTRATVVREQARIGTDALVVRLDELGGREVTVLRAGEKVGPQVDVEFDPDEPDVARIAGTRAASERARQVFVGELVVGAVLLVVLAVRRRAARPGEPAAS